MNIWHQASVGIEDTFNTWHQASVDIEDTFNTWHQARVGIEDTFNTWHHARVGIEDTFNIWPQASVGIEDTFNTLHQASEGIEEGKEAYTTICNSIAKIVLVLARIPNNVVSQVISFQHIKLLYPKLNISVFVTLCEALLKL